jgi:hypothetical protein
MPSSCLPLYDTSDIAEDMAERERERGERGKKKILLP